MFEQEPLYVPRAEPGRFDDLLSLDDVERMLCSGGLRHPAFRLVKAGARLDLGDYTTDLPWRPVPFTGTIDVASAVSAFADGATVVLQALHHTHPPLAAFCRLLEAELEQPVQTNAYFTPRGSQGLPVHHDTHDVFCLQVAGRKRWLVYEPALELPLRNQRYRSELGEPGGPVLDIELEPGDTLYMPRGWLHEALTSDEDSLHLTIGVNVYTWLDAMRAALEECADDLELRRSVPEDGVASADLLGVLEARLQPDDVVRRRRSKLVRTRRPVLEDALSSFARPTRLPPRRCWNGGRPCCRNTTTERSCSRASAFACPNGPFPSCGRSPTRWGRSGPTNYPASSTPRAASSCSDG